MEEAEQSVSIVEECGGVGRGHREARLRVGISVTDGVIGRPACREECGLCFSYVAREPCLAAWRLCWQDAGQETSKSFLELQSVCLSCFNSGRVTVICLLKCHLESGKVLSWKYNRVFSEKEQDRMFHKIYMKRRIPQGNVV